MNLNIIPVFYIFPYSLRCVFQLLAPDWKAQFRTQTGLRPGMGQRKFSCLLLVQFYLQWLKDKSHSLMVFRSLCETDPQISLLIPKETCLTKNCHRSWFGWAVTCTRTDSTRGPGPLWLEDLFTEAGLHSVLGQLFFFINEFRPCRREAIPCALFSPLCWPPNRNYHADFYTVVDFSLHGGALLSPGLFLSHSFTILFCVGSLISDFFVVVVLVMLFYKKKRKK